MTATIYNIRDYQSKAAKERAHKALEEHFQALEAEIAVALWCQDLGAVGFNPVYLAPEKDPA